MWLMMGPVCSVVGSWHSVELLLLSVVTSGQCSLPQSSHSVVHPAGVVRDSSSAAEPGTVDLLKHLHCF